VRREYAGRCVRARMRGHLWSSYFAVSSGGAPLSITSNTSTARHAPLDAGLRPATSGMGLPRTEVRGLRPRKFRSIAPWRCRFG
jgi:putative transposase